MLGIKYKGGGGFQIWRHYLGGSTKSDFVWQGGEGGGSKILKKDLT